jgi:hypothetical protein
MIWISLWIQPIRRLANALLIRILSMIFVLVQWAAQRLTILLLN